MKSQLLGLLTLAMVAMISQASEACNRCGAPCEVQYCEKTVMVPQTFYEKRTITCTEMKPVAKTKTITVCRSVPEVKTVKRMCTVMVPSYVTKTITQTVCKPVYETKHYIKTTMVPYYETKQGVKTVCKQVPETITKTVCEDQGHWEEKCYVDRCGCKQTCKVWVPNIVKREVACTVMRTVTEEVPYSYKVRCLKPEQSKVSRQVCRMVPEQVTRDIKVRVCHPEQRERLVKVVTHKTVQEEKTVKYLDMVPHQVTREIDVPVCKMVPKTIKVPVCCKPVCQTVCKPRCF